MLKEKKAAGLSYKVVFLVAIIVFTVGFVAGTRQRQILAMVGSIVGVHVETGTLDVSSVQTTYQALKNEFDGKLDTTALIHGANRGMVAAAGDKYTVYMDPKEAAEFNNDLSGKIGGGIGAEIGVRNDQPTITRVLPENPAAEAGILAGDIIMSVNDQSADKWDSEKTALAIRGKVGTTVKISVLRGKDTKNFSITRKEVKDPSVYSKIQNGIGILTVSRFDEQTGALARKAASDFKQQNIRGVVLDLRGNPGGYLDAAQSLSSLWLNNQTVAEQRRNDGTVTDRVMSDKDAPLAGTKTIVLIDGGSASASEIVAGALRDHGKATLYGEKSFGKGSVQNSLAFDDGAMLKVTIARWYTPKGVNVSDKGIAPHKVVKRTYDDINANRDPQMDAAIDNF